MVVLAAFAILALTLVLRAFLCRANDDAVVRENEKNTIDKASIAKHLSDAIKIKTISTDETCDWTKWVDFHEFLESTYPLVHKNMKREVLDGYALLYRWEGKAAAKQPVLFMAHMDVVGAPKSTLKMWKHPPFAGTIDGGYVWGRGAIDMKGSLIAIMDACEALLGEGFYPARDVYISLGHDEEADGESGARETAKLLSARGLKFEFVIDEGGAILNGQQFTMNKSIVALAVSEKGYVDVELSSRSHGGHSSRPPKMTTLDQVARAAVKLNKHLMRARLGDPMMGFFKSIAPYTTFWNRLVLANIWFFRPLILHRILKNDDWAAMVRTTFALTQASASCAPNILPDCATATLNVRIAPWDTLDKVLEHIRRVTNGKVSVNTLLYSPPSKVAPLDANAYKLVANAARRTFSGMIVAPYQMVAATDSRYFGELCDNIIRIVPFRSFEEDQGTMHGINERVSIESLAEGARFFANVIETL